MILRSHTKRDWFRLDTKAAGVLMRVINAEGPPYLLPGVVQDGNELIIHRSHLPLVEHPEAAKPLIPDRPDWASRDRRFDAFEIKLRTTQHQAIDFINARRGTLLADEMRLGKTLSSVASHDYASGPFVIVAPLSTRAVWLGWLKRVFPTTPIGVITGRKFKPGVFDNPIVFGHYDVIHQWQTLRRIGTLVLDEAHCLTNRGSNRSMAASLLAARAERVIALTGTPIWKLPSGLWNVIGTVAPGAWGNYYAFSDRYGLPVPAAHGTRYTGLSNGDELNARLSDVMLRRLWKDCAKDLPPITRSVIVAEVSPSERRKLDILAVKLQEDRSSTVGHLAAYRRQVFASKLPQVKREVARVVGAGQPVVVWTWHRESAELIATGFPGAFVIHGDIRPDERERRMAAWKACPIGILIATLAVAGAGIDLSHSWTAIFAEIDYTPAVIGQGEMRTYDPTRPMSVIFVVADHLVDQRIIRALVHKLGASDPLGVGAAIDAIDALRDAVLGPVKVGDLDSLLADMLAA